MRSSLSLLLVIGLAACSESVTSAPTSLIPSDNSVVMLAPSAERANLISTSSVWSRQITGQNQTGALYALFVPGNWNGDVVYYAHGIVPAAGQPVALPEGDGFPDLRDALGGLGYAVAYSSFSENGWAEKDGVFTTHQLREIFSREVGAPRRSFLAGTSLGGLVAENLTEKFPSQYDGTLAMCAPLGGALQEVNYIANVRVLFDLFYPGVVPGDVIHVPAGTDINTQVLGPAQAAVIANPQGLGIIARIQQTPLAGNNGPELVGSLLYALAYDVGGIDDFLGRTNGHNMFDNATVKYEAAFPGLLDPNLLAYINGAVGRFHGTPDGINFLKHYYVPDARLSAPVMSIHTTRDPLVPFFHEASFAAKVASTGSSSKLFQRSIDRYGHCAFSTDEMVDAFQTLVGWVNSGQKPVN